ncbi:MAG: hypothetical protein JW760_12860 [Spirochaetales bacterium]|nr:hypothetical protein [Spirochaetales bacterium]
MNEEDLRKARRFVSDQGMLYEDYNLPQLVEAFLKDMDSGLRGDPSSLAMIPTYYSTPITIPADEEVAVMDAGGTNLRRGILRPSDRLPEVTAFSERTMPGTARPLEKEEFIGTLADFIAPLLTNGRRLGFCFSYPIGNSPDKDAQVIAMTKELQIRNVHGVFLGKELLEALRERGVSHLHGIPVLNDTTALFLSGWHHARQRIDPPGGMLHLGFVLGTGTNCCYMEKNSRIPKIQGEDPEDYQLINMESGGFTSLPRGSVDEELDKTSTQKNCYILEKMASGVYLGALYGLLLRRGAGEGLFSRTVSEAFKELTPLSTRDFSDVLSLRKDAPVVRIFHSSEKDYAVAAYLGELLLERAALAASLAPGAVITRFFSVFPEKEYSGVLISAEGSTLFKVPGYREKIRKYLIGFLPGGARNNVEIHQITQGSLIGAGLAAVSSLKKGEN